MPRGFKLVKVFDDRYYSCSISSLSDIGTVEYFLGSAATPSIDMGPLTVFDKQFQTEDWANTWIGNDVIARAHFLLFRCTYERSDEEYLYINTGRPESSSTTHFSKCPDGTQLATSVTLTSKVNGWS